MKLELITIIAVGIISTVSGLTDIRPGRVQYADRILRPAVEYPAPEFQKELNPSERIFGGSNVQNGERVQFKHQVRLVSPIPSKPGYVSSCGGSIIDRSWVITAAHCLHDKEEMQQTDMYFGVTNLLNAGREGETRTAMKADFRIHPQWNPKDPHVRHDIALIRLRQPLTMASAQTIGVVNMPKQPCNKYQGSSVTVSGWGVVDNKNTGTSTLKKANVKVATTADCSRAWRFVNFDEQICASASNMQGTCQGDSGGPMVINDSQRLTLLGLTSFGAEGCENSAPRVFTCVHHYLGWIRRETGLNF